MAGFQVQGLHSLKPYRIGYSPSASLRCLTPTRLRLSSLSKIPCIPYSLMLPNPEKIASPYYTTWVRSCTICKTMGSDMIAELEIQKPKERRKHEKQANGIFWIILLNIGIFAADHLFQVREIKSLYLYHNFPTWYQFFTATFCHANWKHLSSNLFFLYIFGKLVEEEEGIFALWCSYILTGIGSNLVSWLVLPRNAISVGASGAVFGLFTISVLVKMSWDWRKILEVIILGQFVIEKVMEAAQASTALSGIGGSSLQSVNHIAHLSGALVGVLLVWLLSKIPSDPVDSASNSVRQTPQAN